MRSKKRFILYSIAGMLFLAGFIVMLYPVWTDFLYRQETERLKTKFAAQFPEEDSSQTEQLYEELKRRNTVLYQEHQKDLKDPFSYQQPEIDLSAYGLPDNIIGFLQIEKMDIELPIYLGANQENLSLGAAHLTETSYPIGGENTNSVIAAHRGYHKTAMFRDIEKLERGDKVVLRNFRETLYYQVTGTKIIQPTEIDELLIQPGKDMLTLITCHPLHANYQRYVVYCERVQT